MCVCVCGTVTRNGSIDWSPGGKGMNKYSGGKRSKGKTGLFTDKPVPLRLWPLHPT